MICHCRLHQEETRQREVLSVRLKQFSVLEVAGVNGGGDNSAAAVIRPPSLFCSTSFDLFLAPRMQLPSCCVGRHRNGCHVHFFFSSVRVEFLLTGLHNYQNTSTGVSPPHFHHWHLRAICGACRCSFTCTSQTRSVLVAE